MRFPYVFRAAALIVVAAAGSAVAQLPQTRLGSVFPPGGQAGTTFEVRPVGEENLDYETAPRLLFGHAGITAEAVIDAATGAWGNAFRVTVAADVPAGRYEVMLDGFYGASSPRSFRVEAGKTTVETESDPPAPIGLDEVVYGRMDRGADVDSFTFTGEAGKALVVRCEADTIDSPLQPVVEFVGPGGRMIGSAGGPYGRKAIVAATLPEEGEYVVRVADAAYGGGAALAYRLTVTGRPVVAFVWPPAGVAGQTAAFDVYGYNLPGGEAVAAHSPLLRRSVEIALPAAPAARPASAPLLPAQAVVEWFDYSFRDGEAAAEPVAVYFAPRPLVAEVEPNNDPAGGERITVPAEIAGRFESRGDTDRFVFEAKKGEAVVVEAFAERYGSAADPVVTVERLGTAEGQPPQQLAAQDDQDEDLLPGAFDTVTRDPLVRFDPPEDGTYRVTVRDRYSASHGGPELVYRLSVRRPEPDFRLAVVPYRRDKADSPAAPASVVIRKGESVSVPVVAFRRDGFDGPITVQAENLPAGLTSAGVTIGPGMTTAPLVLTAGEDAAAWRGPVTVVGEATVTGADGAARAVRHEAVNATLFGDGKNAPATARLAGPLTVSLSEEAAPFRLAGDGGAIRVAAGSQVVIPLRVNRGTMAEAMPVAAEDVPKDAKANVEVKPFEPGTNEQLARLVIDPKAPARSFAVAFNGTGKLDYAAFPHRLKRAKAAQEAAAGRLTQSEEMVKSSTAAHQEAVNAAAAAEQAKTAAEQAATAAAAEVERLKGEVTGAEAALAAAQAAEAAADEAGKPAAAQLTAQRTTELEQARERLKAAEQAKMDTAKQAADAGTALEAAKAAVRDREAAMKAAEEARKQSEAAKKAADQAAGEAEKAAAPQKIDYSSPAPPVTVTVVPAPAEVGIEVPNGGQVKRGEAVEIKATAKRPSGFDGPISLSLALPPGVGGLTAEPATIGSGQTEAVLRVMAAGDAAEGDVRFPAVRATFDVADSAPLDLPVSLKVMP